MTDSQQKLFDLSGQQLSAKEQVEAWFNEGQPVEPIFRLFGYAGTGKTTTIRKLIADLDLSMGADVLFGAYTGKAAMVMRKQKLPASTIHSLIYRPVPPNKKLCKEIDERWKNEPDPEEKKRIKKEFNEASKVHFVLKGKGEDESPSDLEESSLLVLDECSMVNDDMLRDILTFRVPLLVLGDPGQLPPIEGEGALTRAKADVMLTEIHRQVNDNPIIDYATRARNGIYMPYMRHGTSGKVTKDDITAEQLVSFDQILTGKNATRKQINQNCRAILGRTSPYPEVGEKLICLKNDLGIPGGLFNGMMCEVVAVGNILDVSVELSLKREIDAPDAEPIMVKALRAHFDAYFDHEALEKVPWWDKVDTNEFDFGYAITVHKAQGSQWDNVLLYDDKFLVWKREERKRWLYTGITRAVESITIAE